MRPLKSFPTSRFEFRHHSVAGGIIDERGTTRRHVNVFVNGHIACDAPPATLFVTRVTARRAAC
jgi:hypothetical protein